MPYDERLADRVREIIAEKSVSVTEKKMFGGLCFMVNEKMCVGVERERLMVRLDPALYAEAMEKDGCQPMDFTGKIMKGYVFVDKNVLNTNKRLRYWMDLALDFNEKAIPSKPKRKRAIKK